MMRVSSNMQSQGFLHYDRLSQVDRNRVGRQIDSQHRIALPSDDPTSASRSVRLQSKILRTRKYQDNIKQVVSGYAIAEGNLNEAIDMVQRIRELAIQAGNSLLSKEDLSYIATEVNEYLEELINVANQKGSDGLAIFAGARTEGSAFRSIRGRIPGADGLVVTNVEYIGSNIGREIQSSDVSRIESKFPGNIVFWAETQKIFGANRVDGFVAPEDTSIFIDGQEIPIKTGDSIHTLATRINRSNVAVKASIDPVENTFVLTGTTPHQIWLSDAPEGSVLRDLGIVGPFGRKAPNNLDPQARVVGGSIFDMVVAFRDALYDGDVFRIGGSSIAGIDAALNNLNLQRTRLGSKDNLLENVLIKLSYEENEYLSHDNLARGLNLTEVLTELSALQTALQASYRVAGASFQVTLMDFLK